MLLSLGIFALWFNSEINLNRHQDITVYISPKSSTQEIFETLKAHNLVRSSIAFYGVFLYGKFFGHYKSLKHGEYLIDSQDSLPQILNRIAEGKVIIHKITIPEGLTVAQVTKKIQEIPILVGDINPSIREGFLLPETYTYIYGDSRQSLINRMEKAMEMALNQIWPQRHESVTRFILTPQDLLTMASIIEKETGVPQERDHVAGVFYNRLEKNMPLQSDPTVIYALTKGREDLGRPLTRNDLNFDSDYNTYKKRGLPPTPIACPGLDSLRAAACPQETEALYFVASGTGGHNFSATLDEHNANVARWRAFKKSKT